MGPQMKKGIAMIIAAAMAALLAGCNTIAGVGKDIEAGGKWMQGGGSATPATSAPVRDAKPEEPPKPRRTGVTR